MIDGHPWWGASVREWLWRTSGPKYQGCSDGQSALMGSAAAGGGFSGTGGWPLAVVADKYSVDRDGGRVSGAEGFGELQQLCRASCILASPPLNNIYNQMIE